MAPQSTSLKGRIAEFGNGLASAWPLMARDLRGMSRQGQLFWIRVLGGTVGIVALALLLMQEVQVGAFLGMRIFSVLNTCLTFTILLAGPVITADCLAQEKREGTLGLLFLAPLRPQDIVLAKGLSNAVRAFTLMLAIAPMMVFPVVFGGVPGIVLAMSLAGQLSALAIALSAGILASTLYRQFIQAAVCGVLYCLGMYLAYSILLGLVSRFLLNSVTGPVITLMWPLGTVVLAFWILSKVLRFAGRSLKKRWEMEAADFRPPIWIRLFSDSQWWREILAWDAQKARSRNPIAWLQEYSWTARLAKWGWCGLGLVGELYVTLSGISGRGDSGEQFTLAAVVAFGMALSGANSFRAERLSGAMELLLVTPVGLTRLIVGRLWGMWIHFFPAVAIIACVWILAAPLMRVEGPAAWLLVSTFVFLPMIGLYISMLPWNVIVAWLVIYFAGVVFPFLAGAFLWQQFRIGAPGFIMIAIQSILGVVALFLLAKKLRERSFAFQNGRER